MSARPVVLALFTAALTFPTLASAATLTTPLPCLDQRTPFALNGTGYTPESAVRLTGAFGADGEALTDTVYPEADGSFPERTVTTPEYTGFVPKPFVITASDLSTGTTTTLPLQVVKFGSDLPVEGRPGQVVTWRFAGFPAGATIYAHFRHGNKTVRDYRFGKAGGPCGTLTAKAKRVPVKGAKRSGGWYVQVDTRATFSRGTRPEFDKSFSVG